MQTDLHSLLLKPLHPVVDSIFLLTMVLKFHIFYIFGTIAFCLAFISEVMRKRCSGLVSHAQQAGLDK